MNRRWDAKDAKGTTEPAGEIDTLASAVLEAAVEVHRVLGPGLFEGVYKQALDLELELRRVAFVRQPVIAAAYKDRLVDKDFLYNIVLKLGTSNPFMPVHAGMKDSEKAKAKDLDKGDTVKVLCEGKGMVSRPPQLGNCTLR